MPDVILASVMLRGAMLSGVALHGVPLNSRAVEPDDWKPCPTR
jgi:hypothetical protein